MIDVLYDHQIFCLQRTGGVSRYYSRLLKEFATMEDVRTTLSLVVNRNLHLSEVRGKKGILDRLHMPCIKGEWLLWGTLSRSATSGRLRSARYSVFHPTYYDPYWISQVNGRPVVLTVYDLIMQRHPECFDSSARLVEIENMRRSLTAASRIICVSETTRRDLIDLHESVRNKIDVIHLGPPPMRGCSGVGRLRLPGRYLLYVGTRHAYKRFRFFAEAISPVLKRRDCFLVCTGKPFTSEEKRFLVGLGIADRCMAMTLDDSDLMACYQRALCFCFPSLYEGFGLPILEAFSAQCPVALSNASCFPEVAADAALYFDPASAEDIADTVDRLVCDRDLAKRLVVAGKRRLQAFSTRATATRTLSVYRRAIDEA